MKNGLAMSRDSPVPTSMNRSELLLSTIRLLYLDLGSHVMIEIADALNNALDRTYPVRVLRVAST